MTNAVVCDNPRGVTRPCATVLLFVLAAFGCEKTNDLPRLQAEAQAMQHQLADHLDELARRATEIGERGEPDEEARALHGNGCGRARRVRQSGGASSLHALPCASISSR